MSNFTIPVDLVKDDFAEKVHIIPYQSSASGERGKITINQNLFCFLIEGYKNVYYAEKSAQIDNSEFLLLSSGNCLMRERKAPDNGIYKSILFFFDNSILTDFFLKYAHLLNGKVNTIAREEPFIVFRRDPFLDNYLQSLELMMAAGHPVSRDMRILKFEELMLYMADKYPQEILNLRTTTGESQEDRIFRQAVEGNIDTSITVEELAFLCNMSVSTFKRRFAKIYGVAPSKWYLQKRMEIAATLLLNYREKPSDVYHKVGYENHSSFTESFKQVYGLTPSEYQQQKLTTLP